MTKCPHCGEAVQRESTLGLHIRKMHPQSIEIHA